MNENSSKNVLIFLCISLAFSLFLLIFAVHMRNIKSKNLIFLTPQEEQRIATIKNIIGQLEKVYLQNGEIQVINYHGNLGDGNDPMVFVPSYSCGSRFKVTGAPTGEVLMFAN